MCCLLKDEVMDCFFRQRSSIRRVIFFLFSYQSDSMPQRVYEPYYHRIQLAVLPK